MLLNNIFLSCFPLIHDKFSLNHNADLFWHVRSRGTFQKCLRLKNAYNSRPEMNTATTQHSRRCSRPPPPGPTLILSLIHTLPPRHTCNMMTSVPLFVARSLQHTLKLKSSLVKPDMRTFNFCPSRARSPSRSVLVCSFRRFMSSSLWALPMGFF